VEKINIAKKQAVKIRSADIRVGDILRIEKDMTFPCDLALLSSSAENGKSFIKTASLDGEKNLKTRKQVKDFDKLLGNGDAFKLEDLAALSGHCFVAQPDKNLHKFDAYIITQTTALTDPTQYNLCEEQILLKGA
jgi:phospholipid-translocating ATPase